MIFELTNWAIMLGLGDAPCSMETEFFFLSIVRRLFILSERKNIGFFVLSRLHKSAHHRSVWPVNPKQLISNLSTVGTANSSKCVSNLTRFWYTSLVAKHQNFVDFGTSKHRWLSDFVPVSSFGGTCVDRANWWLSERIFERNPKLVLTRRLSRSV